MNAVCLYPKYINGEKVKLNDIFVFRVNPNKKFICVNDSKNRLGFREYIQNPKIMYQNFLLFLENDQLENIN